MTKMVKTARGQDLDWDLMSIQTAQSKNVAPQLDITDTASVAARRQQRQKMEAARKLLDEAQKAVAATEPQAAPSTTLTLTKKSKAQ